MMVIQAALRSLSSNVAFITFLKPYNGRRAMTVSDDKARAIIAAQNGSTIVTAAQLAFAHNVKSVYLGMNSREATDVINRVQQVNELWPTPERKDLA